MMLTRITPEMIAKEAMMQLEYNLNLEGLLKPTPRPSRWERFCVWLGIKPQASGWWVGKTLLNFGRLRISWRTN